MRKVCVPFLLLCILLGFIWFRSTGDEAGGKTIYQDEWTRMKIALDQTSVKTMQKSLFTITITDSAGKPVRGAELRVVLSMPEMFCGSFPAEVVEAEPGSYEASGIPVMRGQWEAEALLETKSKTIRLIYPFKAT